MKFQSIGITPAREQKQYTKPMLPEKRAWPKHMYDSCFYTVKHLCPLPTISRRTTIGTWRESTFIDTVVIFFRSRYSKLFGEDTWMLLLYFWVKSL